MPMTRLRIRHASNKTSAGRNTESTRPVRFFCRVINILQCTTKERFSQVFFWKFFTNIFSNPSWRWRKVLETADLAKNVLKWLFEKRLETECSNVKSQVDFWKNMENIFVVLKKNFFQRDTSKKRHFRTSCLPFDNDSYLRCIWQFWQISQKIIRQLLFQFSQFSTTF